MRHTYRSLGVVCGTKGRVALKCLVEIMQLNEGPQIKGQQFHDVFPGERLRRVCRVHTLVEGVGRNLQETSVFSELL